MGDVFKSSDASLSTADQINGGAGVDTLEFTDTTNAGGVPAANILNVEKFMIRNVETANAGETYDFAAITGETQVWSDRSTDASTFDNLGKGTVVGLNGDGSTVLGAVTFQMATATDAVSIAIANGVGASGTAPAITESGANGTATSATITSTGAANVVGTVDLAAGTLTAVTVNAASNLKGDFLSQATDQVGTDGVVTVSGAAAKVEFTAALDNTIKTINASGLTAGGLTATLGTGVASFSGGQGADVITAVALTATTAGIINAGAGTDSLVVTDSALVDTAAEAALYTGFEVLVTKDRATGTNTTADAYDVSLISGITAIRAAAMDNDADDQSFTKLTAAQAAAITVTGDNTANDLTFALATATGTSDVASITLASATATSNVDVSLLTVAGFETLNIAATTGTAGTSSDVAFKSGGADVLTAVNITGTADVGLVGTNTAKAVTVTSTTSGIATISGNFVNASSITTGAGKDAITLGTGFGTYNTGAGDDAISATAAQLNTGANYNVLNGGEGTDTLTISDGAAAAITIVDNNLSKLTAIEKIVITDTTTGNQSITTGGWVDSAFKASGFNLTTTSTDGNVTIDMTSFTGAATLKATTVGTGAGKGAITINTGSGADVITVSAAAAGDAGVVNTFAGDDKITTASAEAFTITAGAGNDTIVLGSSGVNTIVFADTAALNGVDTITSFAKAADIINWVKGDTETAVTGALTTSADDFYQLGGLTAGKADTAEAVATAVTAAATWTAAAATAWIAVSDDDSTAIYAWTDVAGTAGVQAAELTLVGTIDAAMSSAELATAITIA